MNKEMDKTKSKTGRYLIIAAVVLVALVLLVIHSCTIRTPEIHGVVLDAETKKPVAEAWVYSAIDIESLTVAGDVGRIVALEPPHLRSAEDGTFVIPSRRIKKTPFPLAFGTNVDDFIVAARTLDKRGVYRAEPTGFRKRKIEVTINLEDNDKLFREEYPDVTPKRLKELKEGSEMSNLRTLYDYCRSGRFGIEVAIEKSEGCDDWELDFAIKRHERFLERLGKPETSDQRVHYAGAMERLGRLYRKNNDYHKALKTFQTIKDFDEKFDIYMDKSEYESQIKELEQLLE